MSSPVGGNQNTLGPSSSDGGGGGAGEVGGVLGSGVGLGIAGSGVGGGSNVSLLRRGEMTPTASGDKRKIDLQREL
jgi:hypothetical protein